MVPSQKSHLPPTSAPYVGFALEVSWANHIPPPSFQLPKSRREAQALSQAQFSFTSPPPHRAHVSNTRVDTSLGTQVFEGLKWPLLG